MSPPIGVDGFLGGLRGCAVEANNHDGLVVYEIEPVDGPFAGTSVATAVEVAEVQRWPAVPPHWIHLPDGVHFARTNKRPSTLPGFTKHSRQVIDWGRDADPAQAWLSHVRAVIGDATS